MPEFGVPDDPEYFELWLAADPCSSGPRPSTASDDTRRAALVRSPTGRAHPPVPRRPPARRPPGTAGPDRLRPAARLGGRSGRAGQVPAAAPAPSSVQAATLIVARERERTGCRVVSPKVGVRVVAARPPVCRWPASRSVALRVGLRSLDRLNHQVRALDVTSLGTRVDVEKPPEEIAVVVEQVNALLARLEAGFKRERRLSSDIAHELKTPIAELRSLCEVGARWPGDRAVVRDVLRGCPRDRAPDGSDRRPPAGPRALRRGPGADLDRGGAGRGGRRCRLEVAGPDGGREGARLPAADLAGALLRHGSRTSSR